MTSRFSQLADEFIARVRSTKITPQTDVVLVYHLVDEQRKELPPFRDSITPRTTVRWPGKPEKAPALAEQLHLDTICQNIDSLVRAAPEGYFLLRGAPQIPVAVRDFDLEIIDPLAESGGGAGGGPMALEREIATYRRELPRLLQEGQGGRWALIKGGDLVSIWDTQRDAIQAGRERFGLEPILVKHIDRRDPERFARLEAQEKGAGCPS
jgi:hypothetical protein